MNFVKKHVVLSILALIILLSLLFILGETAVKEVAQYIPPASTQTAAVSGAGLVAHYTFDDGTAADSSGNGNNGTVNGATGIQGKIGQALSFDGTNDYITAASGSSIDNIKPLTLSTWVKLDGQQAGANFISKGDNSSGGHGWYFGTSGNYGDRILFSHAGYDTDLYRTTGAGSVNTGAWTHYAVTWDGTDGYTGVHIYENGVEMGYSINQNGTNLSRTDTGLPLFLFGRNSGFGGNWYKVDADDVRVYSRALSPEEIGELFTQGGGVISTPPPPPPPDPVTGVVPPVIPPTPDPTPPVVPQGAPAAPTNLRVSMSATSDLDREYIYNGQRLFRFGVTWDDNSSDETIFYFQRSVDQGVTWESGSYVNANTVFAQAGQVAGTKARYRVHAVKGSGASGVWSASSNVLEVMGIGSPRVNPAIVLSPTQVKLDWFAWTALHDGYRVERSSDGVNFSQIADIPKTAVDFIDTFAFESKIYYYRICPYITGLGCAPFKNVVEAKPAMRPNAPSIGLQVIDHQSINVGITDNSDNEVDFIIQRSADGQNWNHEFTPIASGASSKSRTDTGLQPNTKYYYRAWARNTNGVSSIVSASAFTTGRAISGLTDLYVDSAAIGNNNGSSWQHAWTDVNKIDWTAVTPGTTIHISGGNENGGGKTYGSLGIQKSGTQSAPIRVVTGDSESGADNDHSGRVKLVSVNFSSNHWVTVDGRENRSMNVSKTKDVASNINMEVTNPNSMCIYANNAVGVKAIGIEIHGCGVGGDVRDAYAIWINSGDHPVSDVELAYLYMHDNRSSSIEQSGQANGYGKVKIHHNIIEATGNGVQSGQGVDIFDNIISQPTSPYGIGHDDGVQTMGSYVRIYNNHVEGMSNGLLRIQLNATAGGATLGNIQVYNNVLLASEKYPSPPDGAILIVAYAWPVWSTIPDQTWENILIANNTIGNIKSNAIGLLSRIPKVYVKSITIKNNIVVTAGGGAALSISGAHEYTTAQLAITNNIFSGTNRAVSYQGKSYAKAEDMQSDTGFVNSSISPPFANSASKNFQLTSGAVSAVDKGLNLSSFLSSAPTINYDKNGNPRTYGSGWDIGAYEYQGVVDVQDDPVPPPPSPEAGLVLKLDFEGDDFSGNVFADKSGSGNPADCQRAFPLNGKSNNQCPISTAGAGSLTAAKFTGLGTCMMASDYLAVPGKTSINNLSRGTISLWVSPEDFNYKNSKILDAFSAGVRNTWSIGRGGDTTYYQLTMNDSNGIERDILAFPGGTAAQGPWSLYTITWDGSRIKAYYNGVLSSDVPMTGISEFALGNYLAIGALKHNMPRNNTSATGNCITQYGDPEGDGPSGSNDGSYVFPNAGFFTGKMDDIRIYNRALSASEVSALAQGVTVPNQYILSLSKTGEGSGSISTNKADFGCGKRCAEAFNPNTSVVLTASPAAGSAFTGWSGACSGTGATCTVNMNSHKYATANFERAGSIIASFEPESLPAANRVGFVANSTSIYQGVQAGPGVARGKLSYAFTAPAGDYVVIAKVNAPSTSNNSLYVNIVPSGTDTNADLPDSMSWHMPTTAGFEERTASWGGNTGGTGNTAHVFEDLPAGNYVLLIQGREAGVAIDSVTILKQGAVVVTPQTQVDTAAPAITITTSGIVLKQSISGATLTFTTNEASTCKWGKVAGTAYASLPNLFTASTNKLSHSGDIPNLPDGVTSIYVRCSDLVTPPNINLTDTTATITITPAVVTNDADSDGVLNAADKCPLTPANTPVNVHGCPLPKATRFTVTNLASLDLNSVPNFEISNTLGKVRYTQAHKLLRSTGEPLDLDSHLSITNGIITLNSSSLPELNKPATITLSGLTLTTPKILKDGVLCTTCTVSSYTGGTITFTVPGFSTYSVVEDDPLPQPTYALSVVTLGTGSGTVTGTGISCGSDCTHTANQGSSITLTASPNSNSTFNGWSGGACTGTGSCTISTTASVVATFARIPDPTPPPQDPTPRTVTITPVTPTIVSPAPTPAPTFIQRFIPSFTSTKPTTPTNVTKPRTSSPFVPLPEPTLEETVTTTKLSFTEQVRSIFSYIVQRIQNGFMRVFGR